MAVDSYGANGESPVALVASGSGPLAEATRRLAYMVLLAFTFGLPWENVIVVQPIGTITRTLGLALAGIGLVAILGMGKARLGVVHVVGGVFVGVSLMSLIWTRDLGLSYTRVSQYVQLLTLAALIQNLVRSRQEAQNLLIAYLFGGIVAIIGTLVSYVGGEGYHGSTRYVLQGFDPNDLSIILAVGVPFAFYSFAKATTWWHSALGILYVAGTYAGVLLSASRTGLLGLAASSFVSMGLIVRGPLRRRFVFWLVALGAIGIAVALVPSENIDRLAGTGEELLGGTLSRRTEIWAAGLRLFMEEPVHGVGSGAFIAAVDPVGGGPRVAHNAFVAIAAELGVLGLVPFAGMLAISVGSLRRMNRPERWLWLGAWAALLAGLLALNFDYRKVTWFVIAMTSWYASYGRQETRKERQGAPGMRRTGA